jgi:hypothetical protein
MPEPFNEAIDISAAGFPLPTLKREFGTDFFRKIRSFAERISREDFRPAHFDFGAEVIEKIEEHLEHCTYDGGVYRYYRRRGQSGQYVQPGFTFIISMLGTRGKLYKSSLNFSQRMFPVLINLQHVGRRLRSRAGRKVFSHQEMDQLVSRSLVLSYALEHSPELKNTDFATRGLPIVIPTSGAAFVCHTQPLPPVEQEAHEVIWVNRNEKIGFMPLKVDSPRVGIVVNTSLSVTELNTARGDVYEGLSTLFNDPDVVRAV